MNQLPTRINFFEPLASWGGSNMNEYSLSSNWDKGLFFTGQVGYKDYVYLEGSYRQDWYRAFKQFEYRGPPDNYGYFSVGANTLMHRYISLPEFITHLKLRASYSEVGNSIPNEVFNKGKADLAGKVVGVQQASTGESALQNDPSGKTVKEIKSYADFVSAFMDLGIGRVDAVIADGVIARYLMTKEPGKYKIVEGTDYGVDNFAVGFRKDDTALRDKINGILAEMKKDGTADKIVEKWLGSSADLDKSDAK